MAQLAELPTPEIRGSNPDISNKIFELSVNCNSRKDENKQKEVENGPFEKNFQKQIVLHLPT